MYNWSVISTGRFYLLNLIDTFLIRTLLDVQLVPYAVEDVLISLQV